MFDMFKTKKKSKIDVDALLKETESQYPEPMQHQPETPMPSYNQPAFQMNDKTRQKLEDMGYSTQPQQQYRHMEQQQPEQSSKDELVNAKLDTIKAMLDNLTHRMERLEQELKKRW